MPRSMTTHATCEIRDAIRDAVAAEREACATLIAETPTADVLMACGELSASERRTVKALLPWLAQRIRNRQS